jgi:general secretion pathway protein A
VNNSIFGTIKDSKLVYNSYYNINARPFGLTPDPKYFFATRPHKHVVERLYMGFEQRDGVLILSGEKGIGKTSTVLHMLEELDKDDNTFTYIQRPPQNTSNLLFEILKHFRIDVYS